VKVGPRLRDRVSDCSIDSDALSLSDADGDSELAAVEDLVVESVGVSVGTVESDGLPDSEADGVSTSDGVNDAVNDCVGVATQVRESDAEMAPLADLVTDSLTVSSVDDDLDGVRWGVPVRVGVGGGTCECVFEAVATLVFELSVRVGGDVSVWPSERLSDADPGAVGV
jgi:hypothetical protein